MQKHKQEIKLKDKWVKSEIIKIKLNPEQAVLSCCSGIGKLNALITTQCRKGICNVSSDPSNVSS